MRHRILILGNHFNKLGNYVVLVRDNSGQVLGGRIAFVGAEY